MFRKCAGKAVSILLACVLVFSLIGIVPEGKGITAKAEASQIRSAKISWVTRDTVEDGQANRLFLRKHSADSEVSMQFKIEVVLTGQEPHEPGSVRILFPRQIWHQRDSYYDGGQVQSAGYGGMTFSVPDKPSENSAWYWEEAENGQYAIVNDAAINAAAQVSFECTITGIDVSKIVDMRPSDPLKATVEVTTRSGLKDTMSTQELTAVIDTMEHLSDPGAGMSGQVYSTPESVPAGAKENLPGGPETANKYVFVRWTTWPLYEGSQYFGLDMDVWAGVAEGNGVSIPGIILGEGGVISGGTVGTETSGEQAGEHYRRQTVRYNYDGRGWSNYRAREIWVAYPTDRMQDNKTYTIRAASQWTLTEADPAVGSDQKEVSRAGATASVNYLHAGWEYPAGTFGVYKYSGSQPSHTHNTPVKDRPDGSTSSLSHKKDKTYEMAVGALRNGKTVTLDFEVLSVGYGYSYTAGPTSEVPDLPEGWEQDPSHYLNWTYRMETTDDTISVANISNGGTLGAGDYRFESITIAAPEMFSYGRQTSDTYQLPGSEFGYKPDSKLPKPDVEVWIEKNKTGSWELYQTVSLRSGTKKITFPADANVTGYRTVVVTNQAACKLAVWPKVTILPSEHVLQLAEERLQDYTNVVLKNEARQVTTFYWSAERQDEVLPEQTAWLEANDDYTNESSDSSLSTLTEAGYKVYGSMPSTGDYTYTRTSNDPVNRRVVVTLFAAVYEQANVTDGTKYNEAVAAGAVIPETSGTWYLLLPEHFVPNTSTIQLRSGDRVTDVKVTENFRNSGRTLVTVKATLTPDPKKLSSYNSQANNCWGDKIQISMDMYVPWSDYSKVRNGYAVYHAAFESGNPGRLGNLTDQNYYQTVGYPDVWPGTPNTYLYSISDSQIRGWMSDLDPDSDEERFVYLRVSESIRDADLSEQVEFRKDARADLDGTWGRGTRDENQVTVTEGGKYTYRLTVASKQDAKTTGILIYDALEAYLPHEGYDQDDVNGKKAWSGAWNGEGQWKGTLESVDLSELIKDGCGPKLYYSTTSGLVFDNNIDTNVRGWVNFDSGAWGSAYRLTDTDIWTEVTGSLENGVWTVPDALKGKVTAIAVNAERYNQADIAASYVLDPGEKLSVYLNMAAPTDNGNDGTWNAKGAYDHKKDNAASTDDIDWTGAADPANNMYAYNAATTVYIPFVKSGNSEQAQPRARLESAYSRVGIVPSVVSVRKTWNDGESVNGQYMENRDGLRPKSVTVHLTGVTADPESKIEQSITLSDENGWKGVFQNAPDADSNGNPYTYTVTEDPVPGYTTGVYKETGRSYEIVNTHKKETFTLKGEKLWLNPDGTPAEPTVDSIWIAYRRIGSNGPESGVHRIQVTPDSTGRWIYEFKDLDRYEPGGFEYQYVLEESSVPDGWFAQTEAAPTGVTVTAEYDPEDITTFRNFRKPDFGYAMIYSILTDECKPKDGNTAVPTFTFTLDMTKDGAALTGEFEYILYDKAPQYTGYTTLPEGTAQIGSGTIRNGESLTLPPGQTVVIIGIPNETECTVTETMGAGWTTNQNHDQVSGTIQTGRTTPFSFRNTYRATVQIIITGTKRLEGREQRAREFAFNLSDYNKFNDYGYENDGYGSVIATVKTGESRGVVTGEDGTKTGLAMFTFRATYDSNSTYTMYEYGGTKVLHYRVEEALPTGAQVNGDGTVTFNNVTYDTTRQDVTVTITDNGDGTLKITSTPLVFTNTYGLREKITLTAHKELLGRTLQPDEFSFEVRREGAAEGSAPIARGKNDADGNITFSPEITLTEKDLAAIDPETGIGEVKFLISEVPGTDPDSSVSYMEKPVEVTVKLAIKDDGTLLVAMPGQEILHKQVDCAMCGGSGEAGGLTAVLVDASDGTLTGILPMRDYFNSQYMEICSSCQGTGYDPTRPGTACGICGGDGFTFIECTHANQTGAACPDCFDTLSPYKVLRVNGTVLAPVSGSMTLASVAANLGIDTTTYPPCASCTVKVAYVFSEEEWNSAAASGNLFNLFMGGQNAAALIYLAEGDGECPTCHGTGKVDGELYIDGEPKDVVFTNKVLPEVKFSATKTMDGKLAKDEFEFALYISDEPNGEGTEIKRTKNTKNGSIVFDRIFVPGAGTFYYTIREIPGNDTAVQYDSHEEKYKVTVEEDRESGELRVVENAHLEGPGRFQNRYKDGSMAISISVDGEVPEDDASEFFVEVVLLGADGKPLKGLSLHRGAAKRMLRAAAPEDPDPFVTDANGMVTVRVKAGETVVLSGIPHGTSFTATQRKDLLPEGFSEGTSEGTTGVIRGGEQSTVSFSLKYEAAKEPEPEPSVSPKPNEPSPSEEPQPTEEPVPTEEPKPTDEPEVTPTVEPSATPIPSPTPSQGDSTRTGDTGLPMVWFGCAILCLLIFGALAIANAWKRDAEEE